MDKSTNSSIECSSFENRIQDLMDQRIDLSNDGPLQKHAACCPECKSVLANFQALEQALMVTFDSDLALAPQVQTPQSNPIINWSIAASIMAIAAVLVVMAVPMLNRQTGTIAVAKNDAPSVVSVQPAPLKKEILPTVEADPELPTSPSISLVNYDLPPTLRNAYQYAVELPGIRPIECSLNVTIEALQNSFKTFPQPKQDEEDPDLGHFDTADQSGLA